MAGWGSAGMEAAAEGPCGEFERVGEGGGGCGCAGAEERAHVGVIDVYKWVIMVGVLRLWMRI